MNPRWVSPLRYPGGKVRMTDWLVEAMGTLETGMDVEVWAEPFAGGAGAGLMALAQHDVPELWLTEAHPALATFWQVATSDGHAELAARVAELTLDLDVFYHARHLIASATSAGADPVALALATLVVNRCSRSGMLNGNVGPIGGKNQDGRYTVASRWNTTGILERLQIVAALGPRIQVRHGCGIEVVAALDGTCGIEDEVMLFIDPPYMRVGNGLYSHGMSTEDHGRLAQAVTTCTAPWVMTYDDHPGVLGLYADTKRWRFQAPHAAHAGKVGTELLLVSDRVRLEPSSNPLGKGTIAAA